MVLLAGSLAACVPAYRPGSFAGRQAFAGERVSVRCLDLALDRRPDLSASVVIDYEFGNRCNRPQIVDFASVHVIGRTADGGERTLQPYDPRGELRALRLGGRYRGREAIEYTSDEPLVEVCIDAASLVRAQPEQWVCFPHANAASGPPLAETSDTNLPTVEVGP